MSRSVLVLHPLCPTSHKLVLDLDRLGLLGALEIVVLDRPKPLGRAFPWSVPMLLGPEGEPLAMDPLDAETVKAVIMGKGVSIVDDREQFARSVLYSAYASSIALVHRSLEPMLDESFLAPALRIPLRRLGLEEARGVLRPELGSLYSRESERIARALSIAVVRHLWYSGADEDLLSSIDEQAVGAIVLSMASVGRAFLPLTPGLPDMAGFMAGFIRRRARGLIGKVEREHREIVGDKRYQEILGVSLRS